MKARKKNKFRRVPLTEVVFFQEGPGLRKWQWTGSGMKVINVTNILGDGSVDTNNTKRYISREEFARKYSHFAVENRDIVVASSGNTYGKVGRISRTHLPVMMNTSVIRFHSKDRARLNDDYLYAFLRSPLFRQQVEQYVIGSAQPNFGPAHLKMMTLPLPELSVQKRIAGTLSAYDDLIDNNTRRIAILEDMAQALYREWFVNIRFPGHEEVKLVDSLRGKVPKGWEVRKVTEAVLVNPRTTIPKETKKPHVPMDSLSTNSMLIGEANVRSGNAGSKFRNGDTLFARITPCLENGKTAFVSFLTSDSDVAIGSTEFIVLRSKTLCPEYVYLMARSNEFRDNAIKSMSGASGRQRVQEKCFDKFLIAQPDENTLEQFQSLTKPMFRLVHSLAEKNKNLRRTRDLLLPKLISGEVSVERLTRTPRRNSHARSKPHAS
jgi:type I restriction enzyme S subunit